MEHEHDVPGAGPTRILALEDGDQAGVPQEVETVLRRPISPPPSRPTVVALGVCYMPLLLVTCLLAALRTGGAIDWDWGWVLAPVWLPLVLGTVALLVASIILAFLDERDAARRRAS